jgi:WD40 repeat protein
VTSAENPSTLEVWSVDPLERQLTLTGHTDEVIDAVFDPTGSRIASASAADGTVRIWDSTTGELETTFQVDGAHPAIPVFSNDGTRVAATDFNGPTRVWDLSSRSVIELDPLEGTLFPLNLEFSPDDLLLAVTRNVDGATEKTGPMIYDVATGELVRTLEGHEGDVTDIGFTADGTRVVTSGRDSTVRVWDFESGEVIGTYFGHEDSVQDLQISDDGSFVASSGAVDVRVWDLETLETRAVVFGHRGTVDGIDLSPHGDLLLTASAADGTTRLWDLTPYWSHELVGLPGPAPGRPGGIAFSPDGGILAASRDVDLIALWDTSTWGEIESLQSRNHRMAFGPDGSILASAGSGGVEVHSLPGGTVFADIGSGTFDNVAFGPDGVLVTATADGVHIWRPPSYEYGDLISSAYAIDVAIDREGRFVASAHQDDVENYWVEIRRIDGSDLVATLSEGNDPITALAFDETGERLLSAGFDATGTIWDTTDFTPLHQLEGHTAAVHAAAFDPTRRQVATASLDGTLKIWDTETGVLRLTLPAPGALTDVAYSPNGRHLAAISPEGFVTVHTLHVDELLMVARSRLTRGWTEAECLQYLQTDECPQTEDDSFSVSR